MRQIDTSPINATNGFPFKSGTLDHIQGAYEDIAIAICNALIGDGADLSKPYVLFGCGNTGSGLNYVIGSGAIYYNGEIFLVSPASFTAAAGQTCIGTLTVTQNTTNADPVTFTDGVVYNVHNIRKIVFSAGTSGTGTFDYASLLYTRLPFVSSVAASLPSALTVNFKNDQSLFFAAGGTSVITVDLTNANVGAVVRIKVVGVTTGSTLSFAAPSGAVVIKESGTLASYADNSNVIYMLYAGVNESGNKEVSYILNQI